MDDHHVTLDSLTNRTNKRTSIYIYMHVCTESKSMHVYVYKWGDI